MINFFPACEYSEPCWYSLVTDTHTIPLLPPVGYTTVYTEDTTEATHSHSRLVHAAAIQMCIAEDIWWFSNLSSCHREMGASWPLSSPRCISNSPTSPSQSPSPRALSLSLSPPPTRRPPALQMSARTLRASVPAHPPGGGWPALPPFWYNVMLSLGKGSSVSCCAADVHYRATTETRMRHCIAFHGSLWAT